MSQQREKLHSNLLGLHVQRGNWITDGSLLQLGAGLFSKCAGFAAAVGRGADVMGSRLRLQAYTLSIIDGFYLLAWACFSTLILVALLRKPPLSMGDLSEVQRHLTGTQGTRR